MNRDEEFMWKSIEIDIQMYELCEKLMNVTIEEKNHYKKSYILPRLKMLFSTPICKAKVILHAYVLLIHLVWLKVQVQVQVLVHVISAPKALH